MHTHKRRSRLARRGLRASLLGRRALGPWGRLADERREAHLEQETARLRRLANTQRLGGDYVEAQMTERTLAELLGAAKRSTAPKLPPPKRFARPRKSGHLRRRGRDGPSKISRR